MIPTRIYRYVDRSRGVFVAWTFVGYIMGHGSGVLAWSENKGDQSFSDVAVRWIKDYDAPGDLIVCRVSCHQRCIDAHHDRDPVPFVCRGSDTDQADYGQWFVLLLSFHAPPRLEEKRYERHTEDKKDSPMQPPVETQYPGRQSMSLIPKGDFVGVHLGEGETG